MQAVLSSAFGQKHKVCLFSLETPGCTILFFSEGFFPQCFVGVQTDRSRVEGRLTEPDVETSACLSFLLLQHLPSIFYTTKKKKYSFLPHSKQFADRLETLCAQLWRPNQFPNKSVTKDNLIDLRVCLSSRRCLQSQEGDGRAGRRSNEHLIHHSGRDAPTGRFNLFSLHHSENCWLRLF